MHVACLNPVQRHPPIQSPMIFGMYPMKPLLHLYFTKNKREPTNYVQFRRMLVEKPEINDSLTMS